MKTLTRFLKSISEYKNNLNKHKKLNEHHIFNNVSNSIYIFRGNIFKLTTAVEHLTNWSHNSKLHTPATPWPLHCYYII